MSDEENLGLSHVAFAVLGLVAEYPCHGKDINERIEVRGMREWTAIGKSSIYGVLKNLKEKDLLDSWVEEVDNRIPDI
ncbi:MAG: PadR family transcriptional regulator [Promethearchaeota archaeon]|jgi:DNA-binding PadR family transcriptional regulator